MRKPTDEQVKQMVQEISVNSTLLSRRYGPSKVAEALRGLADSFDKEHESSFDMSKSDFGFNEEHWFL